MRRHAISGNPCVARTSASRIIKHEAGVNGRQRHTMGVPKYSPPDRVKISETATRATRESANVGACRGETRPCAAGKQKPRVSLRQGSLKSACSTY
jgi:hypothetical protein